MPVYNEGENISQQIYDLEKKLKMQFEILIVYDFEEDDTVGVVKTIRKKFKNIRIIKNLGRGVIGAVKTGIYRSDGMVIVVMPADLADDPQTINKMYKKMAEGYDIVSATRYGNGGKKIGGAFLKTQLSRIAGIFTPLLLGIPITDISNGFKMYREEVLKKIKIESTGGWEFSCEIIIKAHHAGFRIGEVATVWRDRIKGKSKFKLLKWLPKYLKWYGYGMLLRLNINRR